MARFWDLRTLFLCLFGWSLILGLVVLMPVMIALFDSPSSPSFSINLYNDDQALTIPKPDTSISPPMNLSIRFDLKIKNENSAVGIHYPDPIKITFSYFPNVSMMVILAKYELDSFYQGNGKTKHVRDVVETSSFPTVMEGTDMFAFRVDLLGSYRYKKAGSVRHHVVLGCVVAVNYTTTKKLQRGFIGLEPPGSDSQLEPPVDDDY